MRNKISAYCHIYCQDSCSFLRSFGHLFWGKRPLWWNRGLYSMCLKGPAQGRGMIHFEGLGDHEQVHIGAWVKEMGPQSVEIIGQLDVFGLHHMIYTTFSCTWDLQSFVPRLFRVHWYGKCQILMTIYLHKWPPIFQQTPIFSSVLKNIQLNEIWFTFDLIDLPLQGISAMEVYDFSAQREECLGNGMIAMWWLFNGHDIPWVWYTMIRSKDMKQSWLCCFCLPHWWL